MRTPISGIVVGFRIEKGSTQKSSDFGKLFVCQPGDKDHDAALITLYVQDVEVLQRLLDQYSSGQLRWIDTYCSQVVSGREIVWLLEKIFSFPPQPIPMEVTS